jgi:dihydropyrimidine dehydrogenase (NADP+)
MVKELISGLEEFMKEHDFNSVAEGKGKSLEYFTTHAHLAELKSGKFEKKELAKDTDWSGEDIANQTQNMTAE